MWDSVVVGTCIVALAMTELRFAQMQPLAVQFEVKEWHVFFSFFFFFLDFYLTVCALIKHAVSVEVILNSWLLWAVKLWVVFTIFYFNPAHLCCTPSPVAFSPPFALGFTVLLCSSCWCDWINFVIAFHVLVLAQCNLDCCQIWSTKCQIRTGCSRFLCCLKICVTKATTQSIQVGHDLLSLIFDWGQFCTGNS